MLKAQLHIHVNGDPVDNIRYTWRELIDRAKKLNYHVLAITCHNRIFMPAKAIKYAKKHGITLIKGIEIEINYKHIIILNPKDDALKIKTFEDLANYKKTHQESFIIAPHPFFPTKQTLKKDLGKHINLFDAIEYNHFFTKTKNYNLKAERIAKEYKKPMIGTSDCHILKHLDTTYSLIDCPPNPSTEQIFTAIRKNKVEIVKRPLSHFEATTILLTMLCQ